jgi:hypothetical protein
MGMAGERIQNERDARNLLDQHKVAKAGRSDVVVQVGPKADHRMAGAGMDGFEIDQDAMINAHRELGDLRKQLEGQLETARQLAEPLQDGTSLVATQMRKAYVDRADPDGGVQAVLSDYLDELDEIRDAIRMSLEMYGDMDADAARGLRGLPGEGD